MRALSKLTLHNLAVHINTTTQTTTETPFCGDFWVKTLLISTLGTVSLYSLLSHWLLVAS